jgi:hypothetical protein
VLDLLRDGRALRVAGAEVGLAPAAAAGGGPPAGVKALAPSPGGGGGSAVLGGVQANDGRARVTSSARGRDMLDGEGTPTPGSLSPGARAATLANDGGDPHTPQEAPPR